MHYVVPYSIIKGNPGGNIVPIKSKNRIKRLNEFVIQKSFVTTIK